jgi:hypothetical protein
MRRLLIDFIAIAAPCAAAAAQPSPLPPKPYAVVTITRPAANASLLAFQARLAAVAKPRLYAELAPLVVPRGFFWDRDLHHAFDPQRRAVDNLAAAVALERHNGIGWRRLAAFATAPASERLESRPGVVCGPARPQYDGVAFTKLLDLSYTSAADWVYPRADETPVRAEPQAKAAVIGSVGTHFIRLLGFEGIAGDPAPLRTQWSRVVLPDGKTGFAARDSLMSHTGERLCYAEDPVTGWHIAGYIAGDH